MSRSVAILLLSSILRETNQARTTMEIANLKTSKSISVRTLLLIRLPVQDPVVMVQNPVVMELLLKKSFE